MTEIIDTRQAVGRRGSSLVNGTSRYFPDTACRPLEEGGERFYCGRWSTSGGIFLSASQDSTIRLYRAEDVDHWSRELGSSDGVGSCGGDSGDDGHAPLPAAHGIRTARRRTRGGALIRRGNSRGASGSSRYFKEIVCRDVGWSVISTDFSGDEKWLAYSSWSPYVHLCNTGGEYELHEALDFAPRVPGHFCLFSIQFSPRNTHIAGGGSDNRVYLANLERKEVTARMRAHEDHVNTVAFADDTGHLLLSGSDDSTIRAWDTRANQRPVGCLTGHRGGLTCISPRGDGRYLISNGKDQVLKLWDLRAMASHNDPSVKAAQSQPAGDYRWGMVNRSQAPAHFKDVSVRDFSGHRVLQTLIRCYFSPAHTTGQRYIISGSQDGRVRIWDSVSGELVKTLLGHSDTVRDVAWHPHLPLLVTSSWDTTVGLWRA